MGDKTCELCGTPVRVVGETTQHYEPLEVSEEDLSRAVGKESLDSGQYVMARKIRHLVRKLRSQFHIIEKQPTRKGK